MRGPGQSPGVPTFSPRPSRSGRARPASDGCRPWSLRCRCRTLVDAPDPGDPGDRVEAQVDELRGPRRSPPAACAARAPAFAQESSTVDSSRRRRRAAPSARCGAAPLRHEPSNRRGELGWMCLQRLRAPTKVCSCMPASAGRRSSRGARSSCIHRRLRFFDQAPRGGRAMRRPATSRAATAHRAAAAPVARRRAPCSSWPDISRAVSRFSRARSWPSSAGEHQGRAGTRREAIAHVRAGVSALFAEDAQVGEHPEGPAAADGMALASRRSPAACSPSASWNTLLVGEPCPPFVDGQQRFTACRRSAK